MALSEPILVEDGCVATTIEAFPPYSFYDGKVFTGFCVETLEIILTKLGYCYHYVRAKDHLYGSILPNGSFTGMIGQLERKEVEIGVCPFALAVNRMKVIDFGDHLFSSEYFIIYPRPKPAANMAGFVLPFTLLTWCLIFGVVFILTAMSSCLLNNMKKFLKNGRQESPSQEVYQIFTNLKESWTLSSWWSFTVLVSQNVKHLPTNDWIRILFGVWCLASFIFGTVYKSNIMAMLIVPKITVPVESLEDLVDHKNFRWSFLKSSVIENFLQPAYKEDPTSILGRAWSGRGELYEKEIDFVSSVVDHGMATISGAGATRVGITLDFLETGKCRMAKAREAVLHIQASFAFRKGSKLKEMMNRYIHRLIEFGLVNKLMTESYGNASHCFAPPATETYIDLRPLSIKDFIGVFILLAVGWTLGIFVMICEIFNKKHTILRLSKGSNCDKTIESSTLI